MNEIRMNVEIENFRGPQGIPGDVTPEYIALAERIDQNAQTAAESASQAASSAAAAKGSEESAGEAAENALQAISASQSNAVNAVEAAANLSKTEIEEKTNEQLARIPEVSELAGDVASLKDEVYRQSESIVEIGIDADNTYPLIDISEIATKKGYYQAVGGQFIEDNDFVSTDKIRVFGGQKFTLTLRRLWNCSGIVEYDFQGNYLRAPLGTDYVSPAVVLEDYEYTVSDDASYVVFCSSNKIHISIKKHPYTAVDCIKSVNDKFDAYGIDTIRSAYTDRFEVYPALFDKDGYMQINGTIAGTGSGYRHCIIDAKAGEKYKISGRSYYGCSLFTFIADNGDKEAYPTDGTVKKIYLKEFDVPSDGKLYVNYSNDRNYIVEILKAVGVKTVKDHFDNKVILFTGDSICQALVENDDKTYQKVVDNLGVTVNKQYGFAEIIKANNPDTYIKNMGIGGTTFAVRNGRDDSIFERLTRMKTYYPDIDYLVIEGGANDYYSRASESFGTLTDHFDGAYDTTSFTGALEQIFYDATRKWEKTKIGFIVTFKTADVSGWKEYMDRAKEVCEKWSIPYIDLYNGGLLNFRNDVHKQNYSYESGGLHPNISGYEIIAPSIEAWLKTL